MVFYKVLRNTFTAGVRTSVALYYMDEESKKGANCTALLKERKNIFKGFPGQLAASLEQFVLCSCITALVFFINTAAHQNVIILVGSV